MIIKTVSYTHLAEDCSTLLTQEAGTKAFCIGELRKMGYEPGRILMVGDAPGDRDAAEKNGCLLYTSRCV